MKHLFTLLALIISISFAIAQPQQPEPLYTFTGTLSGTNEVPPVTSAGTGTVTGKIYEGTGLVVSQVKGSQNKNEELGYRIEIEINYNGLTTALTAAHIHGPTVPGMNGGVLHNLNPFGDELATSGNMRRLISVGGTNTSTLKEGSNKALQQQPGDQALVQAIINGMAYVNLHNPTNPGGALRANLVAVNPAAVIPTMGQWMLFVLALLLSATAVVYVRRSNTIVA